MILVDSSVWIDYFNGRSTSAVEQLDVVLETDEVAVGDLILVEVLQGFRSDPDYRRARRLFASLPTFELLGATRALHAVENYRALRRRGITVRKSIDNVIATFCIDMQVPLLFSDADFEPFVTHLGLTRA